MKQMKFTLALMLGAVTCALALAVGCASLPSQHQKIGAACESIAAGVEAATAAKQTGRISAAQLGQVVAAARPTSAFCQPVAEALNASDYAALLGAAARIAASPGTSP